MILVTGAAGKTGRAVAQALVLSGQSVRGVVRRRQQIAVLRTLGVPDVVVADMRDPADMFRATQGTRAIYHICPNMHPEELSIGKTAIQAAQKAGGQHFVYHSVLHPQVEAMPHHWQKMRVEEQLIASGLPFTILQPAAYMQNVLTNWERITNGGVYTVPYALETRISMVDLADVAAVAAKVLTETGHDGATYALSGHEFLSQTDIATLISAVLGRAVRGETISIDSWSQQARAAGLHDYAVNTLVAMFQYYAQHGLPGNPRVLSWLLGRRPTSFRAFLQRSIP
jgi:uncharacterized protein YbjT (DUF2867 family)